MWFGRENDENVVRTRDCRCGWPSSPRYIYFIHLPLYLFKYCQSRTSIYQKIENLLTLILLKTSIYSKMIEILNIVFTKIFALNFLHNNSLEKS